MFDPDEDEDHHQEDYQIYEPNEQINTESIDSEILTEEAVPISA